MSIISKLSSIDKKFAWSFSGFMLALILGGVTIYTEFIRERKPVLQYEIVGNTNILNVEEDVSNLDILYNGIDIKKTKKVLSVIILKIVNSGDQNILNNHYDSKSPLGFKLSGGEVIKTEVLSATNKYLIENLNIKKEEKNIYHFPTVILESGESFTIKILDLHGSDTESKIIPIGKIAGVKDITVTDKSNNGENNSFLVNTFSGSLFTQFVRLPAYAFVLLVLILFIFIPAMLLNDKIQEKKRTKTINKFHDFFKKELNEDAKNIFNFYKDRGTSSLNRLNKLLNDDQKIKQLLKDRNIDKSEENNQEEIDPGEIAHRPYFAMGYHIDDLEKLKLISINEDNYEINNELQTVLFEFLNFAKIKEL